MQRLTYVLLAVLLCFLSVIVTIHVYKDRGSGSSCAPIPSEILDRQKDVEQRDHHEGFPGVTVAGIDCFYSAMIFRNDWLEYPLYEPEVGDLIRLEVDSTETPLPLVAFSTRYVVAYFEFTGEEFDFVIDKQYCVYCERNGAPYSAIVEDMAQLEYCVESFPELESLIVCFGIDCKEAVILKKFRNLKYISIDCPYHKEDSFGDQGKYTCFPASLLYIDGPAVKYYMDDHVDYIEAGAAANEKPFCTGVWIDEKGECYLSKHKTSGRFEQVFCDGGDKAMSVLMTRYRNNKQNIEHLSVRFDGYCSEAVVAANELLKQNFRSLRLDFSRCILPPEITTEYTIKYRFMFESKFCCDNRFRQGPLNYSESSGYSS